MQQSFLDGTNLTWAAVQLECLAGLCIVIQRNTRDGDGKPAGFDDIGADGELVLKSRLRGYYTKAVDAV